MDKDPCSDDKDSALTEKKKTKQLTEASNYPRKGSILMKDSSFEENDGRGNSVRQRPDDGSEELQDDYVSSDDEEQYSRDTLEFARLTKVCLLPISNLQFYFSRKISIYFDSSYITIYFT
jgi:hypothetical protein